MNNKLTSLYILFGIVAGGFLAIMAIASGPIGVLVGIAGIIGTVIIEGNKKRPL